MKKSKCDIENKLTKIKAKAEQYDKEFKELKITKYHTIKRRNCD